MAYDARCAELARVFLEERYPGLTAEAIEARIPEVAQAIQDAAESATEEAGRT